MRALAKSIHVRTYLPKINKYINKYMHYYSDTCRGTMGIFLQLMLFVLGQNMAPM